MRVVCLCAILENMKLEKQGIPFTMVANEVLCRNDISFQVKGLFAYLFSKPEGWEFSADRIAKKESSEDRKTIQRILNKMEKAGLLTRMKQPDGRMDYKIRFSAESHSPKSGLRLLDPKSHNASEAIVLGGEVGLISNTDSISNTEEESNIVTKNRLEIFEEEARTKDPAYAAWIIGLSKKDYLGPQTLHKLVLEEFIPYWTETSVGGKKQRWQRQVVFDIKLRFNTWIKNFHDRRKDWKCPHGLWIQADARCYCEKSNRLVEPDVSVPVPAHMKKQAQDIAQKMHV